MIAGHLIIYGDEIKFVDILSEKYGIETKDIGIIKWNNWNWEKYPKHISLLSAKGCPSACNFCFENKLNIIGHNIIGYHSSTLSAKV